MIHVIIHLSIAEHSHLRNTHSLFPFFRQPANTPNSKLHTKNSVEKKKKCLVRPVVPTCSFFSLAESQISHETGGPGTGRPERRGRGCAWYRLWRWRRHARLTWVARLTRASAVLCTPTASRNGLHASEDSRETHRQSCPTAATDSPQRSIGMVVSSLILIIALRYIHIKLLNDDFTMATLQSVMSRSFPLGNQF